MSESPPLHPVSEERGNHEKPVAEQDNKHKAAKYARALIVGGFGTMVLAAVAPNLFTVFSAIVNTLSVAVVAYFTMALFQATDETREAVRAQLSVMEGQLTEMKEQGRLAGENMKVVQRELILAHPPFAYIQGALLEEESLNFPQVDADPLPVVEFEIANGGQSEARITEFVREFVLVPRGEALPIKPYYDFSMADKTVGENGICLKAGERVPREVELSERVTMAYYAAQKEGTPLLYFFGFISYEDEIQTKKSTRFLLLLEPHTTKQFSPVQNMPEWTRCT